MDATVHQPTLLLQAGPLGRRVGRAVLQDLRAGAGPGRFGEPDEELPNLALIDLPLTEEGALRKQLDRLLSLPELIETSASGGAAPPTLMVYLVADLAEEGTPEALQQGLDALLALVRGRYAPLFQAFRNDAQSNFHCNPVLLVPPAGDAWPEGKHVESGPCSIGARELLSYLQRLHAGKDASLSSRDAIEQQGPPAVSNIFVLGESSGRYRLTREQLAEMAATWLGQAVAGALGRAPQFARVLQRQADPYATFVCATVEFDDRAATLYCACRTAAQLLDWMRHTSSKRADVDKRAAALEELFDVGRFQGLVPLEKGQRALAQAIDTQCPSFTGEFRDLGLWEDTEEILAHYSNGWHQRNRRRLQAASRELELFRIDEVIEEVEANGAALVGEERERIDRFIDEQLGATDQGNVADTAILLRHLRKRLAAEVEAVQRRAVAPLPKPPDLSRYDRTFEQFERTAREKPQRRRMALWGLLAAALIAVGSAMLLRHVAGALNMRPDTFLHAALTPPWAWLTAALGSVVGVFAYVLVNVLRVTRDLRHFVGESKKNRKGELLRVLEQLSRGADNSLQAFYGTRFSRACDIWVHRTLRAVLKHVDDRLERVSQMLSVLEQQVKAVHGVQRELGVDLDAAGGDQTARVLQQAGMLRRSLVDPAELPRLAQQRRRPRELSALVQAYCAAEQPFARWRSELPLSRLGRLLEACAAFYPDLAAESVLLQPDLAQEATARLEQFLADFARRLDFHLDFSGRLFADDDDLDRSLWASVVTGQPAGDVVRAALSAQGAGDWSLLLDESPGNRVVLLRMTTGISGSAVRWHASPSPSPAPGEGEGGAP
jgi:hypothetical protein